MTTPLETRSRKANWQSGEAVPEPSTSTKIVDWQALFFNPGGPAEKLSTAANRRFAGTPDADSAYNFAVEHISANDWQKLQDGYRGKGKPESFLRVTFVHLMEEYAVRKYGRHRPPTWVRRLNGVWIRVYEMLCRRRLPAETIVDHLCARSEYKSAFILEAIGEIRARVPGCGQYVGEYLVDDPVGNEVTRVSNDPRTPIQNMADAELTELLGVLDGLMRGEDQDVADRSEQRMQRLSGEILTRAAELREALQINDQERLMLRMIYQDGFSVAKAARLIGLHERKAARDVKRVVQRLQAALERFGFDANALSAGEG